MRFPIDNLFDEMFSGFDHDFFSDPFERPLIGGGEREHELMHHPMHHGPMGPGLMRTDVNETDKAYELAIELPGMKKDNIKIKLDNGILTVSTEVKEEVEEHEDKNGKPRKNGRIIRHERHFGSMSRSWYVGEEVKQSDIKAKYTDGVLNLTVPKAEPKPELPDDQKYIAIEG